MKVLDQFGHILTAGDLCRDDLGTLWRFERAVIPGQPGYAGQVLLSHRSEEVLRDASELKLRVLGEANV
jgi:hypothetical protein